MRTPQQMRTEMDMEEPGRDWEAEGGGGWDTVSEFYLRGQADALRFAAAVCMGDYPYTHLGREEAAELLREKAREVTAPLRHRR